MERTAFLYLLAVGLVALSPVGLWAGLHLAGLVDNLAPAAIVPGACLLLAGQCMHMAEGAEHAI